MSKSAATKWAVILLSVAVVILIVALVAQQQQNAPRPSRGGPRVAGAGAPGGGMGGGMGGGGAAPVTGTVAEVDAAGNKLQITTSNGPVWVSVSPETTITRRIPATAADLKVGSPVTVSGRPTAVTAASVNLGEQGGSLGRGGGGFGGGMGGAPGGVPGGAMGAPPSGGAGGPGGSGAPGGQGRSGGQARPATVSGTIASLSPLTVTTAEGTQVVVALDAEVTFTATNPVTLGDVKPGEQVMAMGQAEAGGAYLARSVRLGQPASAGERAGGGMGGPPGGRGGNRGAPGAPGPGA